MKKTIFFLLLILIAIGIGAFFIEDKNGQTLLKIENIELPRIQLPILFPTELTTGSQKNQLYRWQDENGVWKFSNTLPKGKDFEVMDTDSNTNTIPALQQDATEK